MKGLVALGVDCHIGSQLTDTGPVRAAVSKVAELYRALKEDGHPLEYLDVGGGLGIPYRPRERPPPPVEYARAVRKAAGSTGAKLILEPGRVLIGNAGVLVTRVLYRKSTPAKRFVIVDAGMNDLLRPALYEAHHELWPLARRRGRKSQVDVVGPICESTDVLAAGRTMVPPEPGEGFALMSAGAYGMSMASNYNSRPRPAEVLVQKGRFRVIRKRERPEDLWRGETT
jgi:diaminopimelate decarboxylase